MISKTDQSDCSLNEVQSFPRVNILEQGIDKANELLKVKKEYFTNNLQKQRIKIFFIDHTVGIRKIETKVWTITEKALILKHTKIIPLADIVAVA